MPESMPARLRLARACTLRLLGLFQHEMTEIGDDIRQQRGPVLRVGHHHEIRQHLRDLRRDSAEVGAVEVRVDLLRLARFERRNETSFTKTRKPLVRIDEEIGTVAGRDRGLELRRVGAIRLRQEHDVDTALFAFAVYLVVFDFAESRAGRHPMEFLGHPGERAWRGTLVCDDYSGYKDGFKHGKIIEAGCLAHARRKFFDLHAANKSQIAGFALEQFAKVYEIERQVKHLAAEERKTVRQQQSRPVLDALHEWMTLQRQKVPGNSAISKALDYSLNRWAALTRFLDDGQLPVDNNWVENRIRPIAQGRASWLFAGSLRAGQRAAAIMSLIQSARMNGHDPYAYLKDVLTRLPTHKASQIEELLPHRWQPAGGTGV